MGKLCLNKYSVDSVPSDYEYIHRMRKLRSSGRKQRNRSSPTYMCGTPVTGNCAFTDDSPTNISEPSDQGSFYSTFHKTPERKNFSKEEWETFTRDSTKIALEQLVSSPDFTRWAVANADRITLAPKRDENSSKKHRRWFHWL